MYNIGRKKYRGYHRECKRLMRRVGEMAPHYSPDPPFCDETIKLYANLFFKPRGKARRALYEALLCKTESIAAAKPDGVGFCRVMLAVYENNFAQSEIMLFFDEKEYGSFWNRNNIAVQKWTRIDAPSLAAFMGLPTSLTERCYLEEVHDDEVNFSQKIWFYTEE